MTGRKTAGEWLAWWQWSRARKRLDQWIRTLIATRPYSVRFGVGEGSFVNFGTREIVVEPNFSEQLAAHARTVPTIWDGRDVLRRGTLDVLCARTLAYHEAGHVLYTDVVPLRGSTHGWLVNSLEDERIERLTAACYPPAGRDFAELGRRMWLTGFDAAAERSTALLNACLFGRWDHERPPGAPSKISFKDAADRRLWETRIVPLVETAWSAPDTATVAAIALQILDEIGLPHTDRTERHRRTDGDLLRGVDASPQGERHPDDQPVRDVAWLVDGPSADVHDDPDIVRGTLDSRRADIDPSAGRLWMQPYHDLERRVIGMVRRLARELRTATPDTEPLANNRRGRFDARACVRSRGTAPVVRPADEADDPQGLAFVLLIDGTSSMGGTPGGIAPNGGPASVASFNGGRMLHVREAAMLFERACAALHIPLTIGFARDQGYPVHTGTPGRVSLRDPVIWIKRWDTPPDAEGPRALIAGMYGDATAEAVSRSLVLAQRELDRRTEAVKVVIYAHDGRPTDESPEAVKATIDRLRRSQATVIVGLFLGDQGSLPAMEAIFGRDYTVGVDDLKHLPARLGRLLAKYRSAG
jgi:hypothetical protein